MKLETKHDIDDVVFIKDSRGGVKKGTVSAIGIDMSHQPKEFKFIYLIWVSDREDNAGHHERCYEYNMGKTFEQAYYHANCMMPWNIMDDVKRKDFEQFFAKD